MSELKLLMHKWNGSAWVPVEEGDFGGAGETSEIFNHGITGLVGGGAENLDGVITDGATLPQYRFLVIDGFASIYRLRALVSESNLPYYVQPLDYDETTNPRVWEMSRISGLSIFGDLLIGNQISIGVDGTNAYVSANNLTGQYFLELPDEGGVVAVLREYANSAAANAAVSVGDAWWDTTLKKVRVRLS